MFHNLNGKTFFLSPCPIFSRSTLIAYYCVSRLPHEMSHIKKLTKFKLIPMEKPFFYHISIETNNLYKNTQLKHHCVTNIMLKICKVDIAP